MCPRQMFFYFNLLAGQQGVVHVLAQCSVLYSMNHDTENPPVHQLPAAEKQEGSTERLSRSLKHPYRSPNDDILQQCLVLRTPAQKNHTWF